MLFVTVNYLITIVAIIALVWLLHRSSQAKLNHYTKGINCPIRERDGDGKSVGRCWFWSADDFCPRHGDISGPAKHFRETQELTDEKDFKQK